MVHDSGGFRFIRSPIWQLLVFHLLVAVKSAPIPDHVDRVRNLPGAPADPSFPLYSGFLNFTLEETEHSIFYVLAESIRAAPLEAPLAVWLQGGPGGSALVGFSLEHGPYLLDPITAELRYNDLSWNQYANMLYLEAPSGVGFSRSNTTIGAYNDDLTANITMAALHTFMNKVHPRYASREFFITGESYAGVYIPYLTRSILRGINDGDFPNKHFRGIALGNARMDYYTEHVSRAMQMFSMGMLPHKYGPLIFEAWKALEDGDAGSEHESFPQAVYNIFNALPGMTPYNLNLKCDADEDTEVYHIAPPVKGISCTMLKAAATYFNRADVQKSLHAINDGDTTINWKHVNHAITYAYVRPRDTAPVYSQIFEMIKTDFRILFYTGDLDLIIPAVHVARGTTLIAKKNDLKENYLAPRYWQYLGDFGGVQTSYRGVKQNATVTMDVLTVRGAGHLVPVNHPSRSFQFMNNFFSSTDSAIDYSRKIRRRHSVVNSVPAIPPSATPQPDWSDPQISATHSYYFM